MDRQLTQDFDSAVKHEQRSDADSG